MNLRYVADEDLEEMFNILEGLINGLSGGFNDPHLVDKAIDLQKTCLKTIALNGDKSLALKLLSTSELAFWNKDWCAEFYRNNKE